MPFSERRKYPRIPEFLPCQLSLDSIVLVAKTKNLSCGGALCQISESLPLMTKLNVRLELPSSTGFLAQSIQCVGVVVRREPSPSPEGPPSYLTAIYFSEIKLEDRRRIAEFVLQSMLSHDRRRS